MSHVRNLFTWLKDKKKKSFTRLKEDSSNNEVASENDISNIIDKKESIHKESSSLTNLDTSNCKSFSTKSLDDKNINKKKRNIMSESYKKNDDKLSKNKNNELKSSCNRGQFKRTSEVYWIPQNEPIIDEIVIDKCKNIFGSGSSFYCPDVKKHTSNIFQISNDVCLRFDNNDQNASTVNNNKEVDIVISKKDIIQEEENSTDTHRKISQSFSDLRIYEVIPLKEERRGSITRIIRRIPSFKKEEIGCDKPAVLAVCFLDKDKIKEGMSNSYHVFMEDPDEMILSSAKGTIKGQSLKKDSPYTKTPLTPSSSAINFGDKSVSLLKKLRDKSGKNITSKSSSNFKCIQRSESLDEQANISISDKVEDNDKSNCMPESSSVGEILEEKTQSLQITNSSNEENRSERSGSNISSERLSLKLQKQESNSSTSKPGSKPNISTEGEEDDVFITPREDNNFIEKEEEEEKEDNCNSLDNKMNVQDKNTLSINEGNLTHQEPSTSKYGSSLKISKNTANGSNLLSTTRHSSLTKGLAFDTSNCNDETNTKDSNQKKLFEQMEKRRQSLALRRASNVQLVQSVSGRRTSTTLIPLTLAQIHLVRSLWRQIYVSKGPTVIGQTIFHRFFFRNSANRDQFRRCPLPEGFPNHDSFSKAHCKATADMIDKVVLNLDNLENIAPDLERIGRVHAEVLNGDLSSKMWNTIAETFIDCTLEWGDKRCRSETVRKAWALIIAFMVEKIKLGHLEQRKVLLSMKMRNSQIFSDNQLQ
uniref:GLOBIN domain-containing protein n=1 Tax=Strongyloides stercoralis TaxID=6248 RepID=A0A0K0ERW2_STRER